MTKHDHILHWKVTAEDDWLASQDLLQTKRYLQCLFLAHLTIEKLCKAHWVKDNVDDHPPRIHNLARLLAATAVVLTPAQEVIIAELNGFQMDGRYPDYQRSVYKIATEAYTRQLLHDTELFRQCLLSPLP
ncbi:HEPN domain-containing protein [Hymenobacter sp. UYCo722]|uniref:HEPN domain-containing protein n=1 Tax=Hymenobacter sp. UYCo722 TaxID=3156335 RepID=UPI003391D81E